MPAIDGLSVKKMPEGKACLNLLWFVLVLGLTSTTSGDASRPVKSRIIHGQPGYTGQFPFMAALETTTNEDLCMLCGGSLISEEWILTAAHCLSGALFVHIFLGSAYRTEPEIGYAIWKTDFFIHPLRDAQTMAADIALIRIPATRFCEHINSIPLPSMRSSRANYDGKFALCVGWGVMCDNTDVTPFRVQWTRVQIVSNELCKKLDPLVHDEEICMDVTIEGIPWLGDSGGPVFLEETGELIGVFSRSLRFEPDQRLPMMAARVTSFLPWIAAMTNISYT